MKFNLSTTIDGVVEFHNYGALSYGEIYLSCRRSTDEVVIAQDDKRLVLTSEQAQQLSKHLNTVFGDIND